MLPETFAEQHVRIYTKKRDNESVLNVRKGFKRWCALTHCTTPKVCLAYCDIASNITSNYRTHTLLQQQPSHISVARVMQTTPSSLPSQHHCKLRLRYIMAVDFSISYGQESLALNDDVCKIHMCAYGLNAP